MASKQKTMRQHAKRRARERLGMDDFDVQFLVGVIQSGKAKFVERQSNRVTVFEVDTPETGGPIRVVYDSERKMIVTVLPREANQGKFVNPWDRIDQLLSGKEIA